jgi:peptidoglycan/LPS O-acetylase OafA/YrhL
LRLAPAYLVVIFLMIVTVVAYTGFEVHTSLLKFIFQITRWLGLGLLGQPDINGYLHTGQLVAYVPWTLRYEWLYYFSLPAFAFLARRNNSLWLIILLLLLSAAMNAWQPNQAFGCINLFLWGMLAASLACDTTYQRFMKRMGLSTFLGGGAILLVFACFDIAYGTLPAALLGIFFLSVSSGNTYFGLFTNRGAKRMGQISYGVYLCHGLVLSLVFSYFPFAAFAVQGDFFYMLMAMLCAVTVIGFASLMFVAIERPCINYGKKLSRRSALDAQL